MSVCLCVLSLSYIPPFSIPRMLYYEYSLCAWCVFIKSSRVVENEMKNLLSSLSALTARNILTLWCIHRISDFIVVKLSEVSFVIGKVLSLADTHMHRLPLVFFQRLLCYGWCCAPSFVILSCNSQYLSATKAIKKETKNCIALLSYEKTDEISMGRLVMNAWDQIDTMQSMLLNNWTAIRECAGQCCQIQLYYLHDNNKLDHLFCYK